MSRSVWGSVYENNVRVIVFVHWTLSHVENHGAHIDLIIDWRINWST